MKFINILIEAIKTKNYSAVPSKLLERVFLIAYDPFNEPTTNIVVPDPTTNKSDDSNLKLFLKYLLDYHSNNIDLNKLNTSLSSLSLSKNESILFKKIIKGDLRLSKREVNELYPYLIFPKKFISHVNYDNSTTLQFPLIGEPHLNGIRIRFHVNKKRGVAYSEDFCTFNKKYSSIISTLVEKANELNMEEFMVDTVAYSYPYNENLVYRNTDYDIMRLGTDSKPLQLHGIDYYDNNNFSFQRRRKQLEKIVKLLNSQGEKITLIPQVVVNSLEEAWKGYKGDRDYDLTLRPLNSLYTFGETSNYVLLSKRPTDFVKITNIIKSQRGTTLGVIVQKDNKEFILQNIPSHISDESLGKVIEIFKSENGSSFLRFRRDKNGI